MEYGFWFLTVGHVGHNNDFKGWFDVLLAFFNLPNLAVAECFMRARRAQLGSAFNLSAAARLLAASAFVILATWSFATDWAPRLISGFTGPT